MIKARRPAASPARRALLVAAAALTFGACVNIFELDRYEDASAQLCERCEEIPDCEARLDEKLAAATDEARVAWLELYDRLGCATSLCDQTTLECFYSAPNNRVGDGKPCLHSEGCEDFNFDEPEKGGGCCAGDDADEGVCCAGGCFTCEEKLTSFITAGDSTTQLCRSHEETWTAIVGCRGKKCVAQCKPPLLSDEERSACVVCVAQACTGEVDACLKNEKR